MSSCQSIYLNLNCPFLFFVAHSLALAAQPIPTPMGRIPSRVVGVVGIGHVPGIIAHWGKVDEKDIAEIMRYNKYI